MDIKLIILYYLIFINLIGFIAFGIDKRRAIQHKWRIKEKVLFTLALLGGGIGCFIGIWVFHHKTRHKTFTLGIPVIILLEALCIIFLFIPGQAQKEEHPAVAVLKQELDLVKQGNDGTADNLLSVPTLFQDTDSSSALDPEENQVVTLFFKNFDYQVLDTLITETTAAITLELTTIDAKALAKDFVAQSFVKRIQDDATSDTVNCSLSDYYLALHDLLKQNNYDTVTSKCTISLTKLEDIWKIDEDQNLNLLLTGGFVTYAADPELLTPEEVVALQFDTMKKFDIEQMNRFLSLDNMFSADDEYKRTISKALAAQILNCLDYNITGSTDDGLTASVSIDVISCDCHSIIQKYTESLDSYLSTSQALADGISGRLMKSNQILVESINSNTSSSAASITLTLVNDGTAWKIQMDENIAQAILGNIEEAIASISTSPHTEDDQKDAESEAEPEADSDSESETDSEPEADSDSE